MPEPKFLVMGWQYANHLEALPLGNTPPNVSASTEDPFFPATNQIDYNAVESCVPWRALPDDPAPKLRVNKSQVFNGGAEAGDLSGWTVIAGTVTNGVNPNTGSRSFEVADGGDFSQNRPVRSGQKITIQAAAAGNGGTLHCYAYIKELGQVLQPDGSWEHFTDSDVDWSTESGAYDLKTLTAIVPPYDPMIPGGVYTLVIEFYADGGAGRVDDIAMWAWTDLVAVVGNGFQPSGLSLKLYASTNDFSTEVLVVALDSVFPNTYEIFALRGEQYWELRVEAVNDQQEADGAMWTGQLWLSQKLEFTRAPNMDIEEHFHRELVENFSEGGRRIVTVLEQIRRCDIVFSWTHPHEEDFFELRDHLFEAAGYGEHVALVIRADDDPTAAHMVYVPREYQTKFLETDVDARETAQIMLPGTSYPVFTP